MKANTKEAPSKATEKDFRGARNKKVPMQKSQEPVRYRRHDPTLGRYFQELAGHEVLDGDAETIAAKEISDLEVHRWCVLLDHPETASPLLDVVRETIAKTCHPESAAFVRPLLLAVRRRLASNPKSGRAQISYRRAVCKLSFALYRIDLKRDLVNSAYEALLSMDSTNKRRSKKLTCPSHVSAVKRITYQVETAKHEFIQSNLRLVVAISRRYDRGHMLLIDLIQEGNLGLIKAVDRFDYRRGFRFSTYASWWIRHAIGRALADKGHAVRVPVHALDTQHRLSRASELIALKTGRTPTDEELSKETGMDRRRLMRVRMHQVVPVCSLDRELSDSDDRRYIDLLSDEECNDPYESSLLQTWTKDIDAVLGVLTPIERTIIRWRFGLETGEEMTLKEIGDFYDLSRERIRQLQEQALRKLRRYLSLDAAS